MGDGKWPLTGFIDPRPTPIDYDHAERLEFNDSFSELARRVEVLMSVDEMAEPYNLACTVKRPEVDFERRISNAAAVQRQCPLRRSRARYCLEEEQAA